MANESILRVDLSALAAQLAEVLGKSELGGPIVGRTVLRDAVVQALDCSQLQAEQLVDTMVGRNLLVFDREVGEAGVWRICPAS